MKKDLRYSEIRTKKKKLLIILLIIIFLFCIYQFIRFYMIKMFIFDNALINVNNYLKTYSETESNEKYLFGIVKIIEQDESCVVINDIGNLIFYEKNNYTIFDLGKGIHIKSIQKIDGKTVNELIQQLYSCPVALNYEQSVDVIFEGNVKHVKLNSVNNILLKYGINIDKKVINVDT